MTIGHIGSQRSSLRTTNAGRGLKVRARVILCLLASGLWLLTSAFYLLAPGLGDASSDF